MAPLPPPNGTYVFSAVLKVYKYGCAYLVLGSTGDHLTTEQFCTCNDFNFRRRPEGCIHMQVLKRSIQEKSYDVYNFADDEFRQVFKYVLMEVVFMPR